MPGGDTEVISNFIKNQSRKGQGVVPLLTVLFAALTIIGNAPRGQADPYLRVSKNGVIYYYFSNRDLEPPKPSLHRSKSLRINPPLSSRRISPQELESLIQEASHSNNLPPSLVKAIIRVESNFNPEATSPKGAQGLMQLMPGTADELMVADSYNPRENIGGGVRYLRLLLDRFNNRLHLALAAYNAGPERVSRHLEVPAIPETQSFVRQVCTNFLRYSKKSPTPPLAPAVSP
jgi:soluble lytic murein transglycosylase-like protein